MRSQRQRRRIRRIIQIAHDHDRAEKALPRRRKQGLRLQSPDAVGFIIPQVRQMRGRHAQESTRRRQNIRHDR